MNLTVAQLARHLEGEADDSIVVLAPGGVLVIPAAVGLDARHHPSVHQGRGTPASTDTPQTDTASQEPNPVSQPSTHPPRLPRPPRPPRPPKAAPRCRVTATFTVHGGDYAELVREAEKRARNLFGDDNWEFTDIHITAARLATIGAPMLWAAEIGVSAA